MTKAEFYAELDGRAKRIDSQLGFDTIGAVAMRARLEAESSKLNHTISKKGCERIRKAIDGWEQLRTSELRDRVEQMDIPKLDASADFRRVIEWQLSRREQVNTIEMAENRTKTAYESGVITKEDYDWATATIALARKEDS